MLPSSQVSVSMFTICLGKQDVDKLLRPTTAIRWVKASGKLLGLTDGDFGGDFAGALLWQRAAFEVDVLWLADIVSCQACQNSCCII